jgi:membrane-associated phospholipid phosphatase
MLLATLNRWDAGIFSRAAKVTSPIVDRLVPPLTAIADDSRVWLVVAAGMAGTRRRPDLVWSAQRGVLTVAGISVLVNQGVKRLLWRRRPPIHLVPTGRRAPGKSTSSFPSGHTASAVGFAVVAGRGHPLLAVPLGVLAAAVGLSRVFAGLHYPGDVLGGALIGALIGVAVASTRPPAG